MKHQLLLRNKQVFTLILIVGIFLFSLPNVSADLDTNLRFHFTMNESASPIADVVSNYIGASPTATTVAGKVGTGFEFFDTNGDEFDINSTAVTNGMFDSGNSWTLSYWVYPDSLSSNQFAGQLKSYDDVWAGYYTSHGWCVFMYNGGYEWICSEFGGGANENATGQWHLVTIVNNATNWYVYFDNNLSNSGSRTLSPQAQSGGNMIGGYASAGNEFDGRLDQFALWTRALNSTERDWLWNDGDGCAIEAYPTGCPSTPPTPNASDHKTETTTKQQQTTNVTLNNVAYTTIYSYTFAPANTTQFYQSFTIPVNPTASNTLTCKVQLDGTDLGIEHSRTNTAGQIGQILLKTTNTSLTVANHTVDLLCKRTGGGSMVLFDIVGTGHLLTDLATGETIPYYIETFTNTTTSGSTLVPIHQDTHTTADSNLTNMEHHVILEYTATITNNGASTETVHLFPSFGSYNCSSTVRTVSSGGSGSVGGICAIKNVTGNTNYTHTFYANGTNVQYAITYDTKELYLDDADINTTQIDWTKGAETGWNNIATINTDQDLGAGQDMFTAIGISHEGSNGMGYYQLRLDGDAQSNSTQFQRYAGTNSYGVLGAHNVFTNIATGNYTQALWADVTNIDEIIGQLVAYETGKQSITTNTFTLTANNSYTDTSISSFTVSVNGNNYTTTTGTITIPKQGLANLTYYATGYNSISYTNINTSETNHQGQLCQVQLYYLATDNEENSVNYPYNVTYNGTTTLITNNQNYTCMNSGVQESAIFNKNQWWNKTETINKTTGKYNYTFTEISNNYLIFTGATSNKPYSNTVQCSYNGSYITDYLTHFYTFYNTTATLSCDSATNYAAFTATVNNSALPNNQTISITEYTLSLTFTDNVTGNVTWTHDTDSSSRGQYPINSTSATMWFIRIKANWSDETLVKVTFNEKLTGLYNSSTQYYNFRNDRDTSVVETVKVLDSLDGTLWAKVLNYAQEELIEATVRVSYCPTQNGDDCQIVSQILTEPQGGGASPGNPIYLDTSLDYWITVSKTGYESQALLVRGQDLIDDEVLEVKLRPLINSNSYNHHILAPKQHSNESLIFIQTAYAKGGTYFWNTSYKSAIASANYINGAGAFWLALGDEYIGGQDVRVYLYTYDDSTGEYTEQRNVLIRYNAVDNRSIIEKFGDNTTLRVILWIMLILIAGIVGTYITRDGLDTGHYIFMGGTFLLAFILPAMFIPIAGIMALIGIGGMIFSLSRE